MSGLTNVNVTIILAAGGTEYWPAVKIIEFMDTQVVFTTEQGNIRVYMKHILRCVNIEKITSEENTNHANES